MSANTSSCPQTRDNTTGLVYQQAPCNNKNALLVTVALCIPDDFSYELFVTIGEIPPTAQSYVYKKVLTSDKKKDGVFQLSLSNKDFEMPAMGSGVKCNLGVRPYTGEFQYVVPHNLFCTLNETKLVPIFISEYRFFFNIGISANNQHIGVSAYRQNYNICTSLNVTIAVSHCVRCCNDVILKLATVTIGCKHI